MKQACLVLLVTGLFLIALPPSDRTPVRAATSPLQHVVIIDLENHTFDDVLGAFCVEHRKGLVTRAGLGMRCDGTRWGVRATGERVKLAPEANTGIGLSHSVRAQHWAINGGLMDGFTLIPGCRATDRPVYGCLSQYDPLGGVCGPSGTSSCIPNISRYAADFAISDRTFEFRTTPSWAGHMVLASATIQHFTGWNPEPVGDTAPGRGSGCDSGKVTQWNLSGEIVMIPSCVPDKQGSLGPLWSTYTGPRASHVPTIFDRFDGAGVSWKIYNGNYDWSICPTFWGCVGSSQVDHLVPVDNVFTDLTQSRLPEVSFVIPPGKYSAHQPSAPMSAADTWLGSVVSAIMTSDAWSSTAIFITFDDCGCFYDHVNPLAFNKEWGLRVPMIIVSPFARAGFTDRTPATFVSMLTMIEHTFSLPPLNPCGGVDSSDPDCTDDVQGPSDAPAYDYSDAFDFTQVPLAAVPAVHTRLSTSERRWLAEHPFEPDAT